MEPGLVWDQAPYGRKGTLTMINIGYTDRNSVRKDVMVPEGTRVSSITSDPVTVNGVAMSSEVVLREGDEVVAQTATTKSGR